MLRAADCEIVHNDLTDAEPSECDCCPFAVAHGYRLGAAVAFGIIGMFEAMRENYPHSPSCSTCGFDGRTEHPNADYDRCLYRSVVIALSTRLLL